MVYLFCIALLAVVAVLVYWLASEANKRNDAKAAKTILDQTLRIERLTQIALLGDDLAIGIVNKKEGGTLEAKATTYQNMLALYDQKVGLT